MLTNKNTLLTLAVAGLLGASSLALAQDRSTAGSAPPPPPQDGRGPGPGPGPGPRDGRDGRDWRGQSENWMKEQLGVNDEEFKAIQPRIEKVMRAQRDTRGGGIGLMMGGRGRGPGGGFGNNDQPSATMKAAEDLRSALQDKSIGAEEITRRMQALRQAREAAKAELAKAQAELKEVLTPRQEAVFVMMGTLE